MNKSFSVFTFLVLILPIITSDASAATGGNYWEKSVTRSSNLALRIQQLKAKSKAKTTRSSLNIPTTKQPIVSTTKKRTSFTNTRRIYPVSTTKTDTRSTLNIRIRQTQISKPITEIDDEAIQVFSLGFSHIGSVSRTDFKPALLVEKVAFRLIDNTGAVADPTNFSLVTEDQDFDFDKDGKVVIDFSNFRLANGESKSVDIGIKIENPDIFPRINGSFRVRLDSATASNESTFTQIPVKLNGPSISKFVTLYPRTGTSGNPVLVSTPDTIYSRTLSAGEKATVLGIKLGASYDDMILRKITVHNLQGRSIDSWVNKINLINYNSGKTIASTRFINGAATFNINNSRVQINRNSRVHLGFEVELNSTLKTSQDTQFQLSLDSSDVEVWGIGTGREVPSSQKTVNFDSQPFFVAHNGGKGGISHSSNQPQLFATTSLNSVYRFKVTNSGSHEFSLKRISMDVYPSGMAFAGGGSSDFALMESVNGNESRNTRFTSTFTGGNRVQFDAQNEIYIPARSEREFALRVALQNTGGSRSVAVKLLGDDALYKGTSSTLQSHAVNFIWSDHSGGPHTSGSADWFSGYLFPGLPSDLYLNKQ